MIFSLLRTESLVFKKHLSNPLKDLNKGGLNVFQILVDVFTDNPNGLINQLRPYNEVGVLYHEVSHDVYFEISKIVETKDSNNEVIKVTVNYQTYKSYIYDSDEGRSIGVLKLGSFIEEYNPVTNTTITTIYNIFM